MRRTARMPLAAIAALLALTLAPHASRAADAPAPKPKDKAIEAVTSTIFQKKQSSFSGIGIRMRVQVPQLVRGFSIMPTVEYWLNKSTLSDFDLETNRKDATLATLLRYDFNRQGWQPYFGAGVGVHFLSSKVNAPTLGLNDRSDALTMGGLALLGGVKFGVSGRLGNMVELEYHYVPDHDQLKFNWGLSYEF